MSIRGKALFFIILLTSFFCSYTLAVDEKMIKTEDISLDVDVSGVVSAWDEYDIFAEFDGVVSSIIVDNFDVVKSSDVIMKILTGEMAALIKTAKDEDEKRDLMNRWKKMVGYSDIRVPTDGVVVRLYVKNDDVVKKTDKVVRIARKVRVIAKNKTPLKTELIPGLTTIMHAGYKKYKLKLANFVSDSRGYYTFFLDFDSIPDIRIGEKIDGKLSIAYKKNARVVPTSDVVEWNGKRYLLIEFEPGIITDKKTEILSFKLNYLKLQISTEVFKNVK